MNGITAIIPTYNEEETLTAAIESVRFADEIIVIDSFSTDRTLAIARHYGARLVQHEYTNSAAQKNRAIPLATNEWVVVLDADEVIPIDLREEIIATVKSNPQEVGFWIYRSNIFMGRKIKYSGWQGDRVVRLFRKSSCRYETKSVHAEIIADGPLGRLKNKIEHNSYKGFDHYVAKINRYAEWQAKDYDLKTGRLTAYHFMLKPSFRFFKHYFLRLGFLDGLPGLTISFLSCYTVFTRYVKLWLLRKEKQKS